MKAVAMPKTELEFWYLEKQKTQHEIAALYKCSQATIRNYLLKHDIPMRCKSKAQSLRNKDATKRNQGRAGVSNGNYRHGGYVQERIYREMIEISACNQCDSSKKLVVHHKNGNHYDNHPENLEILCRSCHQSYHKQEWWNAKKIAES